MKNEATWSGLILAAAGMLASASWAQSQSAPVASHVAPGQTETPRSAEYAKVQSRLARGWNTWDVHSVATQVLLPEGLAIHVGMKHNTSLNGDAFLGDALIGRLGKDDEVVTPGPHAWDGSYTSADYEWKGHKWRVESAHDGEDLVMLVTPLGNAGGALPPTVVFSVGWFWDQNPGMIAAGGQTVSITSMGWNWEYSISCTCGGTRETSMKNLMQDTYYFAADLTGPVGISAQVKKQAVANVFMPRTLDQIRRLIERQRKAYEKSITDAGANGPILDAIETTLGWDTIYEPEKGRVISPVSRVWSVGWGGYVLFDWDTFFAATMAGMGDKDLAYANALEILREEVSLSPRCPNARHLGQPVVCGEDTPEGFVPNYARAGGWKSFDRSEPPVGAITVLGLYKRFRDRWFLEDAFAPLLKWNRWWAAHRDLDGYLTWGSDPENEPRNPDDGSVGTWQGAIYESGLDNSPMYDGTVYDAKTHLLEYADVGLMSLYVADCDALAEIAEALGKTAEAAELKTRGDKYRAKLQTLWNADAGIFENKDLHTGAWVTRLSPTNFYPMLAKAATPEQAREMVEKHLKNPKEFWGEYVIPSIARDDAAFKDQQYWRGRIWGPMNYLVYMGLENYDLPDVREEFADKSYALFLKEWSEKRHVHENYNAVTGTGDDVTSSDRFYHWGALLGFIQAMELEQGIVKTASRE